MVGGPGRISPQRSAFVPFCYPRLKLHNNNAKTTAAKSFRVIECSEHFMCVSLDKLIFWSSFRFTADFPHTSCPHTWPACLPDCRHLLHGALYLHPKNLHRLVIITPNPYVYVRVRA